MSGTGPREDLLEHRWGEIVDAVADAVPDLAHRFVARVRAIPDYAGEAHVSEDDLFDTAALCIGMLVDCLRAGQETEKLLVTAAAVGSRRAQQNVPPGALATAVQLNFSVIWSELLEVCGPRDAVVLTAHVEEVWRTVDRFAAHTQTSYTEERTRLAQVRADLRQSVVAKVFAPATSGTAVDRLGAELGIDPGEPLEVLGADQLEAQQRLHEFAKRPGWEKFFVHRLAASTVAFWPAAVTPPGLQAALTVLACVQVPAVDGLASVPRAARAAGALLETLDVRAGRPVTLDEGLPALADRGLTEQGIDLAADLGRALEPCTDSERDRLRETITAFLQTGSAVEVSQQLFCHRNTVLNRMNRFFELTGLDVTVPRQATKVVLAWCR